MDLTKDIKAKTDEKPIQINVSGPMGEKLTREEVKEGVIAIIDAHLEGKTVEFTDF